MACKNNKGKNQNIYLELNETPKKVWGTSQISVRP